MDIGEFLLSVHSFFNYFFREKNVPSAEVMALKICEEAGELAGAVIKNKPVEDREEEWADLLFATIHHGIVAGYDMESALARVALKNERKKKTHHVVNGILVKKE